MTPAQFKGEIITYWVEKAKEALASARAEFTARRFTFAMNRAYYACFYAVSALLLKQDKRFSKHSGVRAALHEHVVKSGLIGKEFGKIYDRLFESRQEGDYIELIQFEKDQVEQAIQEATAFVNEVQKLI